MRLVHGTGIVTGLLLAAMVVGCSSAPEGPVSGGSHPIILLNIGTLRADHLGCYGYDRPTSPNIDRLAAESIRFEWNFSQAPHTAPAQASILTGLYPSTHGLVSGSQRLPQEAITLAETLSGHGYATAAFVDGGYLSADFGLDQGFDTYDNSSGGGLDVIAPKALSWLEEHQDENFLLMIHSYDVHAPYAPPQELRDEFLAGLAPPSEGFTASAEQLEAVRAAAEAGSPTPLADNDLAYTRALYDASIRHVDTWVGKLMDSLAEMGLDRRATVVLYSDHGEAFQEHGTLLHDSLHTPVTRVPMLVRLPGGADSGVVSHFVESIDLMPTLVELAGAELPPGIQGESLLPLMNGGGTPPFMAFGESAVGSGGWYVALGGYRMIVDGDGERRSLYHVVEDTLEQRDLADSEGDRITVLEQRRQEWAERVARAKLGEEEAPMDDDTLEQLKSLGYVQ